MKNRDRSHPVFVHQHFAALKAAVAAVAEPPRRAPQTPVKPLSAPAAADVCEAFRQHPRWQVIGFPPDSRDFHDAFWPKLRDADFARRRACDWRAALVLIQQGVTEFATVNEKDFRDFGFKRVWNPLAG